VRELGVRNEAFGQRGRRSKASRIMRTIFFDVVPRTSESSIRMSVCLRSRRGWPMLHAHAEFAHALGRLDEGTADIVVADDASSNGTPECWA